MATIDPALFARQKADAERMKLQQEMMEAIRHQNTIPTLGGGGGGNVTTGIIPPGAYSGGYVFGSPSGDPMATEITNLTMEVSRLRGENAKLRRALENPDLPVATKVADFLNNVDDEEVLGRSAPPFTELNLSRHMIGRAEPISKGTFQIPLRSGERTSIRVVGLIVRDEGKQNSEYLSISAKPYNTYMVPTAALTEGDTREAIADLVAHVIASRVFNRMGESDEPTS